MGKKVITNRNVSTYRIIKEAKEYLDSIVIYADKDTKLSKYANKRVTIIIEIIDENKPKVVKLNNK
jgi:hypothetical protein